MASYGEALKHMEDGNIAEFEGDPYFIDNGRVTNRRTGNYLYREDRSQYTGYWELIFK